MSRIYGFEENVTWMLEARQLLDVNFYPHFAYEGRWVYVGGNSKGSVHIQREAHIDTVILISRNETLTIDEKLDRQNRYTILAETVSMVGYNKPGWMQPGVSKADLLLWAFTRKRPPGLKVHTFWLEKLIEWFWPRISMFERFEIKTQEGNKHWVTEGYQVPIKDIPAYCLFTEPELITVQMSLF